MANVAGGGRETAKPQFSRFALRFMESFHDSRIAHRNHGPGRAALPRVHADRQVGPTRFLERHPAAKPRTVKPPDAMLAESAGGKKRGKKRGSTNLRADGRLKL